MDQSLNCFNLGMSTTDAGFTIADIGFERLNRKPNFNAKETQFIIEMVRKYKFVLSEKALDSATNERKREVWQMICDGINEMTPGVSRSVDEIRKRWQNLNCQARKEGSKFKKLQSEGLPVPALSNFTIQILGMDEDFPEYNGQDFEMKSHSMKIEIDSPSEDNDDSSNQDVGFPGSPVQGSCETKSDNLATSSNVDLSYLPSTPTSNRAEDVQFSLDTSNVNSASKPEVSSQSLSKQSKFTCNTAFPRNDFEAANQPGKPRSSSFSSLKSSFGNQGSVNQGRTFKSKPFNMPGDIQFSYDSISSYSPGAQPTSNKPSVAMVTTTRPSETLKRKRIDDLSLQLHEDLLTSEREAMLLEKEKIKLDREKLKMEQESLGVEMQKLLMEKEKLNLEKEVEREKLRMERERFSMEMQQERQKIALERERLELAREQERTRSRLEQEKLEIEKEKMGMEQEKLALELSYWRRKLLQTRSSPDNIGLNSSN